MKGLRASAALLLVLIPLAGLASTPESLSYQGYLTDRDGSPENGDVLVTFSIYTAEVGGSPQWFDTMLVEVENGLMNVELGRLANPFPVDLFETPLWLGIQVETDQEMIPRRALTSVGFSFKAADADSLQGQSSADLDQSTHVDDLANPHDVTAGQVGAAGQAELDSHTTDTGNPHQVTSAQSGGTDAAVFSAHASNESVHHARYGDAEAVAAMATIDSGNPLNHARYDDSESVAAVLAADGEGSGLDADTLDGMDSQQIISAGTGAVRLMSGSAEIGVVFDWTGSQNTDSIDLALLTPSGYYVDGKLLGESAGFPMGEIRLESAELHYVSDDCTGQAYIETILDSPSGNRSFVARQGFLWRTEFVGGVRQNFYVPKNTVASQAIAVQSRTSSGSCTINLKTIDAYEAFPNDPVVTGFLDAYVDPIVLER